MITHPRHKRPGGRRPHHLLWLPGKVAGKARVERIRTLLAQSTKDPDYSVLDRWPLLRLDWFGQIRFNRSAADRSAQIEVEAIFAPIVECYSTNSTKVGDESFGHVACLPGIAIRRWLPLREARGYRLSACYSDDAGRVDGNGLVRHRDPLRLREHADMRVLRCRCDLRTSRAELYPADTVSDGAPIIKPGIYSSVLDASTILYVVTNEATRRRLVVPASTIAFYCFMPRAAFLRDVLQGRYLGKSAFALWWIRFDGLRFLDCDAERDRHRRAAEQNKPIVEAEVCEIFDRAMKSYLIDRRMILAAMIPAREPVELTGSGFIFEHGGYTTFLMVDCEDISFASDEDHGYSDILSDLVPIDI